MENVLLYPNPAQDVIHFTTSEEITSAFLFDSYGKLINQIEAPVQAVGNVNVRNLAAGTYFLHLQSVNGVMVKKFVKV